MWTKLPPDFSALVRPAPPEPYCPVCHSFGYHGVRCEGIGWSAEHGGEPIKEN